MAKSPETSSHLRAVFRGSVPEALGFIFVFVLVLTGPLVCLGASPLTLNYEDIKALALERNPRMQVQASVKDAARDAVRAAEWQFYPTPSLSADSASTGDQIVIARLQQPLWTGGALTAALDTAEAGLEEAMASELEVKELIQLEVVSAYSSMVKGQNDNLSLKQYIASLEELREMMQRRIEQGYSGENDLRLVDARLRQAEASRARVLSELVLSVATLSELVGEPLSFGDINLNVPEPRDLQVQPDDYPLDYWVGHVVDKNPALKRLEAQVQGARAAIDQAKASAMPTIYARAEHIHNTANADEDESRVLIGVEASLNGGLSVLAEVSGAKAKLQASIHGLDTQRNALVRQVTSTLDRWRTARYLYSNLKSTSDNQAAIRESYQRKFVAGKGSWLDVLNIIREGLDIANQVTAAKVEAFRSSEVLMIIAGRENGGE